MRRYVSVVPTSAHTGEGIADLISLICHLNETLMKKTITKVPCIFDVADPSADTALAAAGGRVLQCTILEVKAIEVSRHRIYQTYCLPILSPSLSAISSVSCCCFLDLLFLSALFLPASVYCCCLDLQLSSVTSPLIACCCSFFYAPGSFRPLFLSLSPTCLPLSFLVSSCLCLFVRLPPTVCFFCLHLSVCVCLFPSFCVYLFLGLSVCLPVSLSAFLCVSTTASVSSLFP